MKAVDGTWAVLEEEMGQFPIIGDALLRLVQRGGHPMASMRHPTPFGTPGRGPRIILGGEARDVVKVCKTLAPDSGP